MPAAGPDLYGTLTAPFNLTEDRYIKAIQSRVVDANSRKVIHHALSFAVDPNEDGDMGDDSGGGTGQFLVEYASGKNATFYTDDTGQLLQAGRSARVSHPSTVKRSMRSLNWALFYPKGSANTLSGRSSSARMRPDLDIPANGDAKRRLYQTRETR
jgi:hypothetical protein